MKYLLLLMLFLTPLAAYEGDIILSFPRSGTNWTGGVIQSFTRRPIRGTDHMSQVALTPETECAGTNRLDLSIDYTLPVLWRTHDCKIFKRWDQASSRLIFPLRNFKECIVKHCGYNERQFLMAFRRNSAPVKHYFANLHFFDTGWKNPKTKHLIIYEDMLANPQRVVEGLLTFLGVSLEGVPEFFKGYDDWCSKILTSYHEQHKKVGPYSQGQPIFHSKDFSKQTLQEVDRIVQERYPALWKRYLHRYATL